MRWAVLGHCSAGSLGAGNLEPFRRVPPPKEVLTPVAEVSVEGAGAAVGEQRRERTPAALLRGPPALLRATGAARAAGTEGPHAAAIRALLIAGTEATGEDLPVHRAVSTND